MAIIDIHTHMLCEEWLTLLQQTPSTYTIRRDEDSVYYRISKSGWPFMRPYPAMFDYELRIAKMDEAGVDIAVLSLSCPQANWGGPEVSERAAAAINDSMAAAQARYPERIRFLAALPWQYPERAVKELARACDAGAVGVTVLGNIEGDSPVDERFRAIWDAINDRRLPVLIHPTAPPGVETIARNGLHSAVGFHFDTTHCLERMINTGFLDDHPNVRVIGSHAGGYLPYIIGRLDTVRRAGRVPSHYFDRIYVDSIAWRYDALELAVKVLGPERVMFGSDYPHGVVDIQGFLGIVNQLPESDRKRVHGTNAEELFGL